MTNSLPRALLLDLDNTIIEGETLYQRTWRLIGERYAPQLGVEPEMFLNAVWSYGAWFWSEDDRALRGRRDLSAARVEVVTGGLEKLGLVKPELVAEIAHAYEAESDASLKPFSRSPRCCPRLHRRRH